MWKCSKHPLHCFKEVSKPVQFEYNKINQFGSNNNHTEKLNQTLSFYFEIAFRKYLLQKLYSILEKSFFKN
jgi:hypothetical protein